MKLVNAILTLSLLPLTAVAQDANHDCPHMMNSAQHMTHETTPRSGLSDEQRAQYLNGEGMGFARPAELNHYPGPRHVLDNADKLQLSSDQLGKTQELFRRSTRRPRHSASRSWPRRTNLIRSSAISALMSKRSPT